jgi:hypothetical protein
VNRVRQLLNFGQSVWLDYLRRRCIMAGDLKRLVAEDGLRGCTSNPTIFDQAIAGGADYDERLRELTRLDPNAEPGALYEAITCEDVQAACDVLRPVYDRTEGEDGFIRRELGVAAAGAGLGLNPFDQPDVELAKQLAREHLEGAAPGGERTLAVTARGTFGEELARFVGEAQPGDYVAIQAFLAPHPGITTALAQRGRRVLRLDLGPDADAGLRLLAGEVGAA